MPDMTFTFPVSCPEVRDPASGKTLAVEIETGTTHGAVLISKLFKTPAVADPSADLLARAIAGGTVTMELTFTAPTAAAPKA